ncbi:hypothetical protein FACS189437_10690 [Bacteroidia bacterium]|nr:hypothetical protein FACS189437_10690 [Bacteroidia bacterium]
MSKGRITGGGTKLVGMVCKTPCPTSCTSGTRILSISYSEDGECCSKLVDKDTGTGTIAECTPGAKQVCTQGVGGTYLKGRFF